MKSAFVRSLVIFVVTVGAFVRTHGQNGAAPQAAEFQACGACFALDETGTPIVVPLESTEVVLDVKPGLLEAEVIQTFTNHGDTALEAIYRYPLPPDSTLTHFEVRFPDRVLVSVVREKNTARIEYVAAKQEGRRTALLEKDDPTQFSTSVANFLPGQTVQAVIRFIQPLEIRDDAIEVRFPMVTGRKYFPTASASIAAGNQLARASDASDHIRDPGHVYAFDIEVSGFPVRAILSDSHRVRVDRHRDGDWGVALEDEITIPDRDFVLRIEPLLGAEPAPSWVTQSTGTGEYGMLTVFPPPAELTAGQARPRDILFLLDQSGSMSGRRLENAKLGLAECLARLRPQDRFQIVRFSTDHHFYTKRWTSATSTEIAEARKWVLGLNPEGGTELQKALSACLGAFEHVDREQVLIVLTDGDVGEEKSLVTMVERKRRRTRVFPIGIGDAPNPFLISKLAACGQGQARFISDDRQIVRELTGMFAALDAPIMTGMRIQFVDARGAEVPHQAFPEAIPDVFLHSPVQTVVRIPEGTPERLIVRGRVGEREVTHVIALEPRPMRGDGIEKLFGSRVVGDLEDMLRRAETPEEEEMIRGELLEAALQFQLVSEQTSRVAVDREHIDAAGIRQVTVNIPQAEVADHAATIDPNDPDVILLSPFTVSTETAGYAAADTLAGGRLRTQLRDTPACLQVVNKRLMDDIAASSLEEALPYVMEPLQQPAAQGGQDCGLLDGLPIATVVARVAVDGITDKSFGLAWSGLNQRDASFSIRRAIAGRIDSDGFASGSLELTGPFGSDSSAAAMALISWDHAHDDDRWSAILAGRKAWGQNQLRARIEGRDVAGYGTTRAARISGSAELPNQLFVQFTAAAHRLERDDPTQFRRASEFAEYDGLGFFNLDLLTAETRSIEDLAAQATVIGSFDMSGVRHAWSAGATWHRRDADWAGEVDASATGSLMDTRRIEVSDRMQISGDILEIAVTAGGTEYVTPGQSQAHQRAPRGSVEVAAQLLRGVSLFGVVAHDQVLPTVPTGRYILRDTSLVPMAAPRERHEGGQIGLRFDVLEGRVSGHLGRFSERIHGQSFRDWAWERDHAEDDSVWIDEGRVLRESVSTGTWRDYVRQGWVGAVNMNLLRELSATASWCVDTADDGPYRGGNRRASLVARYRFEVGGLRGLDVGFGVAYRNAMIFDDGLELRGGMRWDAMLGYSRGYSSKATRIQINWIDLTDSGLRPTRFSVDRGRRVALSVSRSF